MSETSTTEEPLVVPPIHHFDVPEDATIDSLKCFSPMSVHCNANFTDEHFGTPIPAGLVAGGFYDMGKEFSSEEAVDTIGRLARQTGRKLRVGTPLELLSFLYDFAEVLARPERFIALGKVWNNGVFGYYDGKYFDILVWGGGWYANCKVFIVEDL
jgi:hypothetical protein